MNLHGLQDKGEGSWQVPLLPGLVQLCPVIGKTSCSLIELPGALEDTKRILDLHRVISARRSHTGPQLVFLHWARNR